MTTQDQPVSQESSALPADLSLHEAADLMASFRTAPTELGTAATETAESVTEEISSEPEQPEVESEQDELNEEATDETVDEQESLTEGEEDQPEEAKAEAEFYEIDGDEVSLDTIKEWRDAGLRLSDYTQKTQVLAQQTQAVGDIEKNLNQFAHASSQMHKARLSKIEGAIKQYSQIDWPKLAASDQQKFTVHKAQYEQLKGQYNAERQQFAGFLKEFNTQAEQATAKRAEAAYPEIKNRIKGWNEGRYHELREFAVSKKGANADQVNQITEPWMWEVINDSFVYRSGKALEPGKRKIRRTTKTLKSKASVPTVDQNAVDEKSGIAAIANAGSTRDMMNAGAALLAQRRGRKR